MVVNGTGVKDLHVSVVSLTLGEVGVVRPVLGESSQLLGGDGLHLLNNDPLDALGTGRGGQGSSVLPVLGEVDGAQEGGEVNLVGGNVTGGGGLVDMELLDEGVGSVTTSLNIEEHTDDGTELDVSVLLLMNNMELKVVVLSVDSMLGGGVEMELEGLVHSLGTIVEVNLVLGVSFTVLRGSGDDDRGLSEGHLSL